MKTLRTQLFVIKKSNQDQYYCCSSVHGCGWTPHRPKQAFTKSELSRVLREMIDQGVQAGRMEIIELTIPIYVEK